MHVRGMRHMPSLQQIESRPKGLGEVGTVTGQADEAFGNRLQAVRLARLEHERALLDSELKTREVVRKLKTREVVGKEPRARPMHANRLAAVRLILDKVPGEEAGGSASPQDGPGLYGACATTSLESLEY